MNKLDQLLKLAQLDQMSAGPQQAQQGQVMQMLMSMLQMNQQGEQAASGQDLERERMAQAAKQFESQLGLNRETAGQEQDYRMGQQGIAQKTMENAAAHQALMGGLDLTKIMQENQNAVALLAQHEKELQMKVKEAEAARAEAQKSSYLAALAHGATAGVVPAAQFNQGMNTVFPEWAPKAGAVPAAAGVNMEQALGQAHATPGLVGNNNMWGMMEQSRRAEAEKKPYFEQLINSLNQWLPR